MKPIRPLDSALINKIAAGEVVERPLSVVKELTENAIDAGASVITVEIREGGLGQIRITDNGCGIPSDELLLAFARHATSKIEKTEDLFEIMSLGFRGEALSSIAAVAQVEMITKTTSDVSGTRIEVHGGHEIARQQIGCADGTTLIVSNLFYNTPARRKFIKKPAAEAGYISDIMQKLALGNPGIAFRYINNGQLSLQTHGYGEVKSVIHAIYGREVSAKLVEFTAEAGETCLCGYIGKPEIARGNRSHGTFFLNGRYIKSKLLRQAVENGMKTMLPSGKFPLYVLYLTLPPGLVDVNVHPNKTDVRFADETGMANFVAVSVREVLMDNNLIPEVAFIRNPKKRDESNDFESLTLLDELMPEKRKSRQGSTVENNLIPLPHTAMTSKNVLPMNIAPMYPGSVASSRVDISIETPYSSSEQPRGDNVETAFDSPGQPEGDNAEAPLGFLNFPERESFETQNITHEVTDGKSLASSSEISVPNDGRLIFKEDYVTLPPVKPFFHQYTILGLLFKTYWLVSQGESLFLIDQHAAHERVLFEEITAAVKKGAVHSQPLLETIPLRLTPRESQTLREHTDLFERFGFEIADYGDINMGIRSVPFILRGPVSPALFTDILDSLENAGRTEADIYDYKINSLAMMSCKAAVKANDALTEAEAQALIVRMLALENPFTCPHGRPTIIEITKRELERKFKRVT